MEAPRLVSSEELRTWRRRLPRGHQRGVAQRARSLPRVSSSQGDTASLSVPAARRATPRETYQRTLDHLMRWSQSSRQDYLNMVRLLRVSNPWLISHLTDEQAAAMLEDGARRKAEQAVTRVFQRTGRAAELQIKTGGY